MLMAAMTGYMKGAGCQACLWGKVLLIAPLIGSK